MVIQLKILNYYCKTLSNIEGKFLLSSYPSEILQKYSKLNNWHTVKIEQNVSVSKKGKRKIEVLTANYPIVNPILN